MLDMPMEEILNDVGLERSMEEFFVIVSVLCCYELLSQTAI